MIPESKLIVAYAEMAKRSEARSVLGSPIGSPNSSNPYHHQTGSSPGGGQPPKDDIKIEQWFINCLNLYSQGTSWYWHVGWHPWAVEGSFILYHVIKIQSPTVPYSPSGSRDSDSQSQTSQYSDSSRTSTKFCVCKAPLTQTQRGDISCDLCRAVSTFWNCSVWRVWFSVSTHNASVSAQVSRTLVSLVGLNTTRPDHHVLATRPTKSTRNTGSPATSARPGIIKIASGYVYMYISRYKTRHMLRWMVILPKSTPLSAENATTQIWIF